MHDEMPGFFPGRPGGEHDEPLLDMILERRPIPPGAPPETHGLARMLAAVAGPAEPGDLAGQAAAHAAFARLASPAGTSPAAPRSDRRPLPKRPARGRLPLVAALTAVAAGLGSTAAAYAGVLPSPIQDFAHAAIGAPAPPPAIAPVPRVVTSSPAPGQAGRGPSGSAGKGSATSSRSAGHRASPDQSWNHGRKADGVPPGQASCPPGQGQDQGEGQNPGQGRALGRTQNPVRPSPAPNPTKSEPAHGSGGSGQAQNTTSPRSLPAGWPSPLPPLTTACPDGNNPAEGAHASGQ